MSNSSPSRPIRAWEIVLVTVGGVIALHYGIPAYFRLCVIVGEFAAKHFGTL